MITVEQVRNKLKEVYDPEVGLNVVDLGLVYDIKVNDKGDVDVEMTLTTPGCPLHGSITGGARSALMSLENAGNVNVDLIWEPAWTPEMMTEEGKKQLGRM